MTDVQPESGPESPLLDEIGASLASLRARFTGVRPVGASVEVKQNVVRWILPELNEADVDTSEIRQPLSEMGYRRETNAAVSEAMGRKVQAKMSKLDKKTGVTVETFVLDSAFEKN